MAPKPSFPEAWREQINLGNRRDNHQYGGIAARPSNFQIDGRADEDEKSGFSIGCDSDGVANPAAVGGNIDASEKVALLRSQGLAVTPSDREEDEGCQ